MKTVDPFHFRLYGAFDSKVPSSSIPQIWKPVTVLERSIQCWRCSGPLPPLALSFESLLDSTVQWTGLSYEMDGSFVWVGKGGPNAARWKMDGMIYDRAGIIQYIEVKGICDSNSWKRWASLSKPAWVHLVLLDLLVSSLDFETLVEAAECTSLKAEWL